MLIIALLLSVFTCLYSENSDLGEEGMVVLVPHQISKRTLNLHALLSHFLIDRIW